MSKTTIADCRVRMKPTKALLELIDSHKDSITDIPENIIKALKKNGYSLSNKVEILAEEFKCLPPTMNTTLLNELCSDSKGEQKALANGIIKKKKKGASKDQSKTKSTSDTYLYLSDLKWLNNLLARLRKEDGIDVFLHNIIETCTLELPENVEIVRNPVLEARCQRLREEQQNREYRKMTKNVDAVLKNYPEDTIAYQMKALNSQIIAVLQFVFSVIAGFVFGFLGIELIIGNLEFGLRLLLGIMFALIIALAEIYFLAKKLNEFDNTTDTPPPYPGPPATPNPKNKVHTE